MALLPHTDAALDTWLRPQSWDSDHPTDMGRFYDFVSQYHRDYGGHLNESDLHDAIAAKVPGGPTEVQHDIIRRRVVLAATMVEFLEHTGR
jgi:hypothetical protein